MTVQTDNTITENTKKRLKQKKNFDDWHRGVIFENEKQTWKPIMGRQKKYQTEEERKEARKKYLKQWRESNKEKIAECRQINKEKKDEYNKQYNRTPMGRAHNLVQAYKVSDKKANRGKCTLTAKWIVDNIFTKKCIYCGESDWTKLGCDRIYNFLPHTEDNVVCCCGDCNVKKGTKSFEEFF